MCVHTECLCVLFFALSNPDLSHTSLYHLPSLPLSSIFAQSLPNLETNKAIYIVMEYADGGDLYQKIINSPNQRLSLNVSLPIFRQMISALGFSLSLSFFLSPSLSILSLFASLVVSATCFRRASTEMQKLSSSFSSSLPSSYPFLLSLSSDGSF